MTLIKFYVDLDEVQMTSALFGSLRCLRNTLSFIFVMNIMRVTLLRFIFHASRVTRLEGLCQVCQVPGMISKSTRKRELFFWSTVFETHVD